MSIFDDMTPIDELPTETRKIAVKALQFRDANNILKDQIDRLGGRYDFADARLNHLIGSLVRLGVVTEQAMWEIVLDWEKYQKPQLHSILSSAQLREADKRRGVADMWSAGGRP